MNHDSGFIGILSGLLATWLSSRATPSYLVLEKHNTCAVRVSGGGFARGGECSQRPGDETYEVKTAVHAGLAAFSA